MRKITLFSLSLFVAASAAAGNITGKMAERLKRMNDPCRPRVAIMGQNMRTAKTFQLEKAGFPASPSMTPFRSPGAESVATLSAPHYGILNGPDGDVWFYTQNTVTKDFYNKSTEIVIYDNAHNEAGRISYVVPEGKKVNAIVPHGQITSKVFDRNESTLEVVVYLHFLGENYNNIDSTFIFNMQGERVCSYEGQVNSVIDIKQNEWTRYQRVIFQRSALEIDEAGHSLMCIDVLKPAGWSGNGPTVEHTFKVDYDLIQYSDGPCFSVCEVEGEPYYVLSYYRDTYVTGYDPATWEMIVRDNNEYVLEVYDKKYERVDSFAVPLNKPDDALYRFAAFSMFSDKDMSRNYFTSDGSLNYVITYYDYITATDDNRFSFDVFNGKGEHIKNICDNVVSTYFRLSDIRGHESQWAFMQAVGNSQQIRMVDLPSCTHAVTIPAEIDGQTISTTLDRYPKGDSYQYVISMGMADMDDAGNVISRVGWYNKDLTLDRFVKFNIGPEGQYFTPMLYNESLDPYTFDTDDEHEYPFLAKIRRQGSTVIDNTIVIANEDGSVLREYRGDEKMAIWIGGILNYGKPNAEFFIATLSQTGSIVYDINYYPLPFSRFTAGGDGTKKNPYLISTLGDMQQIKADPSACYKLTADIDMSGYPDKWTPIEKFTGTLDGDGHALKNFSIAADSYSSGLFGTLGVGSKVCNLVMTDPEIVVGEQCQYAGFIGGQAITDTLTNVHIYGARVEGRTASIVGGLVGQASIFSAVSASSFCGTVNLPGAETVGGIVGDLRTGSTVTGCLAEGGFTALSSLGGIVGVTGMDGNVIDCHANVTLKAENTVGGIVGNNSSRSVVSRCRVEGSVEATKPSPWDGLSAGGIIGSMASDWTGLDTVLVSGCVSAADILIPATEKDDKTVNRIVGRTIANETYEAGEQHKEENALADNYALNTVTVGGLGVTSDDAKSVNGATKATAEATKDFFTSLGYVYGSDVKNPWKGSGMPVLWFEDKAMAIELSQSSISIAEGATAEITATVFGTDASAIEFESSDPSVAVVEVIDEDGNTATISIECKKIGTAVITAKAGDVVAECVINAVSTAVTAVTDQGRGMTVHLAAGRVEAAGASRMSLYNAAGQLVTRAAGSTVSTAGISAGVYVVEAVDAEGRMKTCKVVVR